MSALNPTGIVNEQERLAVLHRHHILDTLPETDYDGLVFLAAQICGAPIALISLVDAERIWFKAKFGLDAVETPREDVFCSYAILNPAEVMVVPDARGDKRFCDTPLVTGALNARFYAGAPIVVSGGDTGFEESEANQKFALGTICVVDHQARHLTDDQERALQALSRQVGNLLDLRLQRIRQQEAHRRLQEAQTLARMGSWEVDLETGELLWSDEMFHLMGFDPADGQPEFERAVACLHPDDRESHLPEVEQAKISGDPFQRDIRLLLKDGGFRWVMARGAGIGDPGKIVRLQGTVQDITERKESEERLRQLSVELARRNDALRDFASAASHDLKEPLRKIRMFGDRLRDRIAAELGKSDPDSLIYLDRMTAAAERMQRLVEGLLALALVTQKGEGNLSREPVDLNAIVSEVVSDLEVRLSETGGRVVQEAPLPVIKAHPLQMRQLLQNLIGNALKFHRPGVAPQVCLSAAIDEPRGVLEITVRDNGIGFVAEDAERIFGTFERLNGTEFEGSGIGLAICRRIAEGHGGSIRAESAPGEGATFFVTLPLS